MNCPLCRTQLENQIDEHYFACSKCGAYVKDKKYFITPAEEKSRYQEHNNDVNDERYQNFTSPITQAVLGKFKPCHLGLDYGCGTGPVITAMLRKKSYNIITYDPFFFPDKEYLNHKYDYIFSCEVFEHFHHPQGEIEKLLRLLKPKGYLLVMTHIYDGKIDFKNWYYRKDPTHVFIYTAKTMKYIRDKFKLTVEKQGSRITIFKKLK